MSIVFVYTQLNVKTVHISNNSVLRKLSFKVKNCSVSNNSVYDTKTVPFQTIQLSISIPFLSIWPIDRVLSGVTTPGQSWPGSEENEEVLRIPQSSSITGISPSDCLVSYAGDLLVGSGTYPCAEMRSVYSTVPVDWASKFNDSKYFYQTLIMNSVQTLSTAKRTR